MHAVMVEVMKKVASVVALCSVNLWNGVEKIKTRYFSALF
ncbi:MAG: hypothetical protein ACI9Q9_001049 [Flavobacterium sp.]|jgi:hypothetical protein